VLFRSTLYLYLFDFDNTLYPTTYVRKMSDVRNKMSKYTGRWLDFDTMNKLDKAVVKLFKSINPLEERSTPLEKHLDEPPNGYSDSDTSSGVDFKYNCVKSEDLIQRSPRIIIISNSSYQALRYNMCDLEQFEYLYNSDIRSFEIISCRDEVRNTFLPRDFPKVFVARKILKGFIDHLILDKSYEKIKIISFGDDEPERVALATLQLLFIREPKVSFINVMFKPELSADELTLNIETVLKNIEIIKNSDKDIEISGKDLKL
jgi:hypothetical protein